jgi:xanthine dehydrogenase YagR molybdenum-binding subunit
MEPHATIAVWQGDTKLTLYDATQGIFGVRNKIAKVFGLDPRDVRVINHYVGGGFGCKGTPWSHVALAALAARMIDRAVKLVVTRQQMCSLVGHRPRTIQQLSLAAGPEGGLTAIRHEVFSETSRFDQFVEPAAMQTRMLYDCANVETSHRLVRIDIPTPTFQRAPGMSTGTFAPEPIQNILSSSGSTTTSRVPCATGGVGSSIVKRPSAPTSTILSTSGLASLADTGGSNAARTRLPLHGPTTRPARISRLPS